MDPIVCKVTGQSFTLTDAERATFAQFGIPLPDISRDERLRRKLAFHNDTRFFWRKSSLSGKRIYSVFTAEAPFPVYAADEWEAGGCEYTSQPKRQRQHRAWPCAGSPRRGTGGWR